MIVVLKLGCRMIGYGMVRLGLLIVEERVFLLIVVDVEVQGRLTAMIVLAVAVV